MKKEFYKMEYESWDEGVECFGVGEPALVLEGAYLRLCHMMYRRRGPMANNANVLAKLWGVHIHTARALLAKLIDHGKVILESGGAHIINTRVSYELDQRGILSSQRSDAGRTGGLASGDARANQLNLFNPNEAIASSKMKQTGESRVEKEDSRVDKKESGALRAPWPDNSFQIFYSRFPNKVGKDKAIRAFNTVKKSNRVLFDELMAGLERYIASKPHDRPWLNPATFLNQGRWADQPAGTAGTAQPVTADSPPAYQEFKHGEVITESMCPTPVRKQHLGKVFIAYDTDEWHAWLFYLNEQARKTGKRAPIIGYSAFKGSAFPARWPPEYVQQTPAR